MNTKSKKLKMVKKVMPAKLRLAWLCTLALAVLVTGCSTTNTKQTAVKKTGEVCPECRTITLDSVDSSSDWRGGPPTIAQRHECPGCRGVVTLSPGPDGYRHECSVCKQTPYACQVAH